MPELSRKTVNRKSLVVSLNNQFYTNLTANIAVQARLSFASLIYMDRKVLQELLSCFFFLSFQTLFAKSEFVNFQADWTFPLLFTDFQAFYLKAYWLEPSSFSKSIHESCNWLCPKLPASTIFSSNSTNTRTMRITSVPSLAQNRRKNAFLMHYYFENISNFLSWVFVENFERKVEKVFFEDKFTSWKDASTSLVWMTNWLTGN